MKILIPICLCITVLTACSYRPPLIEDDIIKMTIECESGDIVVIDDLHIIKKFINEVNNSKRESSAPMDLYLEHSVSLENNEGEKEYLNLYSNGRSLFSGYYIYSNIDNFCGN